MEIAMTRPAPVVLGPLTAEISDPASPVRRFLDDRFAAGVREVQRNYRAAPPGLAVHPAAAGAANPGTIGTAADWLLRFLLHPQPDLDLPLAGVLQAPGPASARSPRSARSPPAWVSPGRCSPVTCAP
jgi:hypothetical protein